jgi:hypothetical protein
MFNSKNRGTIYLWEKISEIGISPGNRLEVKR